MCVLTGYTNLPSRMIWRDPLTVDSQVASTPEITATCTRKMARRPPTNSNRFPTKIFTSILFGSLSNEHKVSIFPIGAACQRFAHLWYGKEGVEHKVTMEVTKRNKLTRTVRALIGCAKSIGYIRILHSSIHRSRACHLSHYQPF